MAKDWKLKQRKPVRHKKLRGLLDRLTEPVAIEVDLTTAFLEQAEYGPWSLLIVDKSPLAMEVAIPDSETDGGSADGGSAHGGSVDGDSAPERIAFPTLRGVLAWEPERRWCEVDHGAIPFLLNGADCMAAGIHNACDCIEEGDLIWIRDQQHGKPLAIGWALMSAADMIAATSGKAVKSIHYVGDELWELEL
jgi:PUA domain protein